MQKKKLISIFLLFALISSNLFILTSMSAILFSDGFESGDLSAWTGTWPSPGNTVAANTSYPHHGLYCVKSVTDGDSADSASVYKTVSLTKCNIRAMNCRFTAIPASGTGITFIGADNTIGGASTCVRAGVWNNAGAPEWYIRYRHNAAFVDLHAKTTLTPAINTNYVIELEVDISGAKIINLYVNGSKELGVTSLNCDRAMNNAFVGFNQNQGTVGAITFYCDCVVVADSYIGPETSGNWQYAKKMYFNNAAVAENLVNFPVLINLRRAGADFWSHVGSTVNDLRFTDSDGVTDLYFEVEYWNYAAHEGYAWVKVPQIDASSINDFIYLYYGNPSPPQSPYLDSTKVWDSNFMMVHHLEEASGTVTDSTSHGNNGRYNGTTQDVEGKIDGADEFNGVDNYIAINHSTSLNFGTGPFTISLWVKYNSNNVDSDILRKGCTTNTPPSPSNYKLELVSNALHGNLYSTTNGDASVQTPLTYSDNTWHYVVFLREATTIRLYVDGSLKASASGAVHDLTNGANMSIGSKDTLDDDFYDGQIDEVQISNTARSSAWIAASYSSMNDQFVTFMSEGDKIELTVTSPQSTTYFVTTVPLVGSTNLAANITYSLDGQATVSVANKTMTFSTSLTGLSYDTHHITVYAVESTNASNTASTTIDFAVTQPGEWQYVKKLVFNNLVSAENLIDFPVLINLTRAGADFWSHVSSDFNDLRFFDSDFTELYFEVEYWNYAGKQGLAWVKIPQIDAGSASDFVWLYYGNLAPPVNPYLVPANVWDSHYVLVMHLSESSGTRYDSTANNNDGSIGGTPTATAGNLDGACDFDALTDYLEVADSASLDYGDVVTLEMWLNPHDVATNFGGIDKGSNTIYLMGNNTSGQYGKIRLGKSTVGTIISSNTALSEGSWTYVVGTKNGATARIYLNGILDAQTTSATSTGENNALSLRIGQRAAYTSEYLNSVADEIRVSNIARSADWIKAQSLSMTDQYITFGSEQAPPHPPDKPFNPSPPDGASDVSTSTTLSVDVTDPDGDPMDVTFYQVSQAQQPAENFTIIVLPDTQYYSASYPAIFDNQTQWIVNNAVGMNVLFVTHEGDIIDGFSSTAQWDNANHSLSILDNGNFGWGFGPGNHDLNMDSDTTQINLYFGTSRFTGKTWYGGCLGGDNANNYEFFNNGPDEYLILHLQYNPSIAILQWANSTLTANPGKRVILVTHEYLSGSSRDSVGNTIWNNFIRYHTDQIFLVLCGHSLGEAMSTDTSTGHTVYQVLADYQGEASGGNGWLRILDFRPAEDKIYVKTYSPHLNEYQIDANSQFTLSYDMTGTAAAPPTLIGVDTNVPSGGTASVPWTELDLGTTYFWYAVAEDGNGGMTQSDTWNFTTFTSVVYHLSLNAGWNMVSFPVTPADTSFSSIFGGLPYYQVLTWSGTSYVTPTNMEAGRGYWVLVLSSTTVDITGAPVESYELDLPAGWSMIGSIYGSTVNAATVFPSYYQLLTWSGTSYVTATTIEPGKGYWALVLTPTHIKMQK
jgi:hypothetical protein